MPNEVVLEAAGIGHRFGGSDWLFRDIDISVREGEIVAVIGPNARGKTTLLSCLVGVRAPREGTVTRPRGVGYVPQAAAAEHPFTAHEIVVMGRARRVRAWASPSRADRAAAGEALERVGVGKLSERAFRELSGGQRQLVLMARALVSAPGLIVLDEPTSALDLKNQRRVLSVIRDLSEEGIGVLFTTHDPTHALHVSRRTLLMDREIEIGKTADLLAADTLSRVFQTPVVTTQVEFGSGRRTVVAPDLIRHKKTEVRS
ncbi:ABC transporter ATP-binding protein [Leucobacter luti]|uniref:ABC transporter ATP-binding protein n=1 Tax=Leucobacter luti TaxID=340320 RepID=UPI003D017037